MEIHFLVHEAGDSVGVVVVEGVRAGQKLNGWVMAEDETMTFEVLNDIPIRHKIALKALGSYARNAASCTVNEGLAARPPSEGSTRRRWTICR